MQRNVILLVLMGWGLGAGAGLPAALADGLSQAALVALADEAGGLFRQANEAVQKEPGRARELYEQAILRYRRIIEEGGIANAALHYNIGNAYLLKGDPGRAILHYRRAQRLPSGDAELTANLRKNLEAALQKRRDQVPVQAQKQVLHTLFFWHYDFGKKTKFTAAVLAWTAAWLGLCVWLWRRRGKGWLGVTAVGLLAAVCLAGSLGLDVYGQQRHPRGVIVAAEVVARQGDGENYAESFKEPLHSGTEFLMRENRTQWLRIELASGDEAWIPAEAAEMI